MLTSLLLRDALTETYTPWSNVVVVFTALLGSVV